MSTAGTASRGLFVREPPHSHSLGGRGACMVDARGTRRASLYLSTANSYHKPLPLRGICPATNWPQAQGSTASSAHILLELAPPGRQHETRGMGQKFQEASCPPLSVLLKIQEYWCHLKMSTRKYQWWNHIWHHYRKIRDGTTSLQTMKYVRNACP